MINLLYFNTFLILYLCWVVFRLRATAAANLHATSVAGQMLAALMDHLKVPADCECEVCDTKPLTRQEYPKADTDDWLIWERGNK